MKKLIALTTVLLFAAGLAGCGDDPVATPPVAAGLTGVWKNSGYDAATRTTLFARIDDLAGDVVAYEFRADHTLGYRSFGWCATPPLSYHTVEGSWQVGQDGDLVIRHPEVISGSELRAEIVSVTPAQLRLRFRSE